MRALLTRMVKDRTILFVVAPVFAIAAILAASLMGGSPTDERAAADRKDATSTTTTTAVAGAEVEAASEEAADGSTTYSGSGSEARQDALGDDDTGYVPPAEVLDETLDGAPAATTTIPGATTVPGATTTLPTTTLPTTTLPTTTTTTPGPPPVVSESPAVALLPVTGIVVAGLGLGLLGRRRSRRRA